MSCFPQPPKNKNIFSTPSILTGSRRSETIAQKGPMPSRRAHGTADPTGTLTSAIGAQSTLMNADLLSLFDCCTAEKLMTFSRAINAVNKISP
jgi:hypothetical protein